MLKQMYSHIFNSPYATVNNAVITIGNTDDSGKGKHFKSRFIQPGLVKIEGHGIVLLKKETIDNSLKSMVGSPVIIKHQDITNDNADELRCGVISDAYFNDEDGWYYAEGVIWNDKALKYVKKGWSVSCSYDFTEYDDAGGVENNIKYDKEFTKLNFTHLALVDNPRYERANIVFNSKDDGGRWITIKGTHVFIPDGKSVDEVMKEKFGGGGSKEKGDLKGKYERDDVEWDEEQLVKDIKAAQDEGYTEVEDIAEFLGLDEDEVRETLASTGEKEDGKESDFKFKTDSSYKSKKHPDGIVFDLVGEDELIKGFENASKGQTISKELEAKLSKEMQKYANLPGWSDKFEQMWDEIDDYHDQWKDAQKAKDKQSDKEQSIASKEDVYKSSKAKAKIEGFVSERLKHISKEASKNWGVFGPTTDKEPSVEDIGSGAFLISNIIAPKLGQGFHDTDQVRSHKQHLQEFQKTVLKKAQALQNELKSLGLDSNVDWDGDDALFIETWPLKNNKTNNSKEQDEMILEALKDLIAHVDNERDSELGSDKGRWITIHGSHIFVRDGQTLGDAIQERGWGKKEGKDKQSDAKKEKEEKAKKENERQLAECKRREKYFRDAAKEASEQGNKGLKQFYIKAAEDMRAKQDEIAKRMTSKTSESEEANIDIIEKLLKGESDEKKERINKAADYLDKYGENYMADSKARTKVQKLAGIKLSRHDWEEFTDNMHEDYEDRAMQEREDISSEELSRWQNRKHIRDLIDFAEQKEQNRTNNSKEQDMLLDEIKKLIKRVENNKENEDMIENEKVDKRKLIDEVGGILKDKVDEEVWRTIIGKLEKMSYNESEAGTADNKKVKNEDEEDEEKVEEVKEDVKEDVENKCKNSKSSFDKINEIYNSIKTVTESKQYTSRQDKLDAAVEYFS